MNEKEFDGIIVHHDPVVYCLAHIARQLTRIADQGDKILNPSTLEKLDRLNLFLQYAFEEDAKKPTPDVPTDALVEAVKAFCANEGISTPTLVSAPQSFKVKTESLKILYSALAAHEKAVR